MNDADHILEYVAADQDQKQDTGQAENPNGGKPVKAPETTPEGFVFKETFEKAFRDTFKIAGNVSGFQTMLAAAEMPEAGPASSAIYDILAEWPAMHWIIQPAGLWTKRLAAIGYFAMPVAAGCAAELKEKRAQIQAVREAEKKQSESKENGGASDE